MLFTALPFENKIATNKPEGKGISREKLNAMAEKKWLEHFSSAVSLTTILSATHLPRKDRQRAARELQTVQNKQVFWSRLLEYCPDTREARQQGYRDGAEMLQALQH